MSYYRPQTPPDQTATRVLRVAFAALAVLVSCYASTALGIAPQEWTAGIVLIVTQLAIQRAMER